MTGRTPLTLGSADTDPQAPHWRLAVRANGALITDTSLSAGDRITVEVNGRAVAVFDGTTGRLPEPDCRTCLDSGWLPVVHPGDHGSREWVQPCPCRPGLTYAEAAELAATGTGCRVGWANPAGTHAHRPYLARPVPPADLP